MGWAAGGFQTVSNDVILFSREDHCAVSQRTRGAEGHGERSERRHGGFLFQPCFREYWERQWFQPLSHAMLYLLIVKRLVPTRQEVCLALLPPLDAAPADS